MARIGLSDIEHHLEELAIAGNPLDPRCCLPGVSPEDRCVLDVGCGIGQTLAAAGFPAGARLVGVDVDAEAIDFGRRMFPALELHVSPAEELPFADETFDLIVSRVALPYTYVPRAVAEIYRVLKPGGRVWFLLHRASMDLREITKYFRERNIRAAVGKVYVLANGVLLHLFGVMCPRPWSGTYASFQTTGGFTRLMKRKGFTNCVVETSPAGHFIFRANKQGTVAPSRVGRFIRRGAVAAPAPARP
jgi:ubiquinone/menaquinone biosynthesis C-methylase UbiE